MTLRAAWGMRGRAFTPASFNIFVDTPTPLFPPPDRRPQLRGPSLESSRWSGGAPYARARVSRMNHLRAIPRETLELLRVEISDRAAIALYLGVIFKCGAMTSRYHSPRFSDAIPPVLLYSKVVGGSAFL